MNVAAWQSDGADRGLLTESLCQELNARAGYLADGLTALPDKGRLLTQSAALARQEAAFAYASQGTVALTASRHESAAATTPSPVNDLYLSAFHSEHGRALDYTLTQALSAQTRAWLKESIPPEKSPELKHFAAVHANRRKPTLPFDGYFFGYNTPPAGGLSFSCSGWEQVFTRPGQTWIEQAIAVKPAWSPDDDEPERLVRGIWVHRWLEPTQAGTGAVPMPSLKEWQALIQGRAEAVRRRIASHYETAGRALPDWWEELHATAMRGALQLAEQIVASGISGAVNAEYTLPADPLVLIPEVLTLPLRGRIDLLIQTAENVALVVDFKTGKREALKVSRLLKGDGVQLALYTLALNQLGYKQVEASLLTPERTLEPQLSVEALHASELQPLWQAMAQMHRTGTVGHRPAFRDPFRHVGTYPLATLEIPERTLQAKWYLTHPALKPEAVT
ncbi:MAG: PD-(D/E)XK nuclease family protein, partial [Verrucomicrobiota bacterium]